MASPAAILKDPNFHVLPIEERRKVMLSLDPQGFGALPSQEQDKVFASAAGGKSEPAADAPGVLARAAGGFNDAAKETLKAALPHSLTDYAIDVGLSPLARPAMAMLKSHFEQGKKALDTRRSMPERIGRAAAAVIPVAGPMAADLIETGIDDPARAVGQAAFMGTTALAPKLVPKLAPAAGAVAKAPGGAFRALGKIIDNPAMQDIAGVVSPRAAHALALARRTKKAVQAFSAPDAVPESVPASAAIPPLWDEIAVSQAGRKFVNLSPAQQAGVQRIAEGLQPRGQAAPPPEATPPPTPGRFNSEEFRTPPQAAAPPVVEPPAPASPVTPAPSKRVGGVKQVGLDARKLADKLVEWKLSPDEAAGMPKAGWVKLAFEAGVPAPTAAVQRSTIFGLKKALAGPPKTATELFEQFRKSGRVAAVSQ